MTSLEKAFKQAQNGDGDKLPIKPEAGKYNYPVKSEYAWRRYREDQSFLKEFNEYEEKKKESFLSLFKTDNDEYIEWLPYNSLGVDWNGVEYNQTSQQVMPRDDWVGGKMKSPEEFPTNVDPMHVRIFNY